MHPRMNILAELNVPPDEIGSVAPRQVASCPATRHDNNSPLNASNQILIRLHARSRASLGLLLLLLPGDELHFLKRCIFFCQALGSEGHNSRNQALVVFVLNLMRVEKLAAVPALSSSRQLEIGIWLQCTLGPKSREEKKVLPTEERKFRMKFVRIFRTFFCDKVLPLCMYGCTLHQTRRFGFSKLISYELSRFSIGN